MPFKVNIAEKGLTWKADVEGSGLVGKSIADSFDGKVMKPELEGYEFKITGGSDFAGFPMIESVEGIGLKKLLLTKGWGMHDSRKGIRLRKTVRGKTISDDSMQINLSVIKSGTKKLKEIFPEQNVRNMEVENGKIDSISVESGSGDDKSDIVKVNSDEVNVDDKVVVKGDGKVEEEKSEEIAEEIAEEVKEEIKDDIPSSPETGSEEKREKAAVKIAEEVKEDIEEATEEIAEEEIKKKQE
jgi:small subunit ribosomal protein S6e